MSAESAINSLIASLNLMADHYSSTAQGLLSQAATTMKAGRLASPDAPKWQAVRQLADRKRIPRPPSVLPVEWGDEPELGEFVKITQDALSFSATKPSLSIPKLELRHKPRPPRTQVDSPVLRPLTLPDQARALQPDITPPTSEPLTVPQPVLVDPLGGTPPDLYEPQAGAEFSGDVFHAYEEGLTEAEDPATTAWLKALRKTLAPLEGLLTARLEEVLQGRQTGLPDAWETKKYEQAQYGIFKTRQKDLDALDRQPLSITGLPSGASSAARIEVELAALTAMAQGAEQAFKERQEREVKHLQWALALAVQAVDAALALRGQETGWRLKALLLALDGAEVAQDAALKVLAFKEKEIELRLQYNEGQKKRLELLIQIEQSKLEPIRLLEAHNKNVLGHNERQLQIFKTLRGLVEAKIAVFRDQIELSTTEQAWHKLELQVFETEVNLHKQHLRLTEADYADLKTRIRGDTAKAEGELLKLQRLEVELRVHAAEVQAERDALLARHAQNRTALEAHKAIVDARLEYLKTADESAHEVVKSLAQRFKTEATEQRLQAQQQRQNDEAVLSQARNDLQRAHVDAVAALKASALRLQQNMTLAHVLSQGASVTGGIATQAFAGVNGVGAKEIVEGG